MRSDANVIGPSGDGSEGSLPEAPRISPKHPAAASRRVAYAWLLFWLLTGSFTWGLFLPYLSEATGVNRRVRYLEGRGIDPSAMFYTEHGRAFSAPTVLRRNDREQ